MLSCGITIFLLLPTIQPTWSSSASSLLRREVKLPSRLRSHYTTAWRRNAPSSLRTTRPRASLISSHMRRNRSTASSSVTGCTRIPPLGPSAVETSMQCPRTRSATSSKAESTTWLRWVGGMRVRNTTGAYLSSSAEDLTGLRGRTARVSTSSRKFQVRNK